MKIIRDKLLERKLNKVITKSYEFIYKLSFVKHQDQFNITTRVDGNNIYSDIYVKCLNTYEKNKAYEEWKRHDFKINFSIIFNMHVYLNIIEEKKENSK